MSYEDLFNFDGGKTIFEECDVPTPVGLCTFNPDDLSEETTDVFSGLDLDCRSELSSPSDSDSKASDIPEKPVRKQLVIGAHIKINQDEHQKFTCTICNCSFSRKQQVRYHDYCVTGKRPLKCDLCGKGFIKKSHLVYHVRTHTGETPFKCHICRKGFKQKAKLKRHERTHQTESRMLCFYCKKSYSDKDSLRKHEQKHSDNIYKCTTCKKSYADKFTLKQHIDTHKSPNYVCDVCGRSFLRKNSLNVHKQIHEDNYPFECDSCHRTFRNKKELRHHSVVHDKNNPGHECDICNITFGRKDNLLRHIRNCHLDPYQKKPQKEPEDISADELSDQEESSDKPNPTKPSNETNSSSMSSSNLQENQCKTEEIHNDLNDGNVKSLKSQKLKVNKKKTNKTSNSKLIVNFFPSKSKYKETKQLKTKDTPSTESFKTSNQKALAKELPSDKDFLNLKMDSNNTKSNNGQIPDNNYLVSAKKTNSMSISDTADQKSDSSSLEVAKSSSLISMEKNNVSTCSNSAECDVSPNIPADSNMHSVQPYTSVIMHTDVIKAAIIAANRLREPVIKTLRLVNIPLDENDQTVNPGES